MALSVDLPQRLTWWRQSTDGPMRSSGIFHWAASGRSLQASNSVGSFRCGRKTPDFHGWRGFWLHSSLLDTCWVRIIRHSTLQKKLLSTTSRRLCMVRRNSNLVWMFRLNKRCPPSRLWPGLRRRIQQDLSRGS